MSFVVLQSAVHEEARMLDPETLDGLRACIIGGHGYTVEAKEAGTYTGVAQSYKYPDMPKGATLDTTSLKVYAQSALCYYKGAGFYGAADLPDRVTGPITLLDTATARKDSALKSYVCNIGDGIRISDGNTSFDATVYGLVGTPVRTILLSRNLPAEYRDNPNLTVELFMQPRTIELAADDYVADTEAVMLRQDISALDVRWHEKGTPIPLPITSATILLSYRVWLSTFADKVYSVVDFDDINKIAGAVSAENPLRFGVAIARQNSNETPVDYIAVADPSKLESWKAAFAKLRTSYGIVPLTHDEEVLRLARRVVAQRAAAEARRECVLWQNLRVPQIVILTNAVVDVQRRTDGDYTVTAQAGTGTFIDRGVGVRDIAQINGVDCSVSAVINQDTIFVSAPQDISTTAGELTVWHKRNMQEYAHSIGAAAVELKDKRIRAVWPDRVTDGASVCDGYFMCAALAGLRSGVAIQQDLTNVQIVGVAPAPHTVELFDVTQLDMMAELGVWIVTDADGYAVTRSAITTADIQATAESNESVVTNLDAINKVLRTQVAEILGTVRATSAIQNVLKSAIHGKLQTLMMDTILRIGPQVLEGEVASLRRHVILENSLVLSLRLVLPVAAGCGPKLGRIEIQQKLVA